MNMRDETHASCRVILSYPSLVKLTVLLGFCAGVFAGPLLLLLTAGGGSYGALNLLFGAPIAGAATGLLMSVLGSPLYAWISSKSNGRIYTGSFQIPTEPTQNAPHEDSAE